MSLVEPVPAPVFTPALRAALGESEVDFEALLQFDSGSLMCSPQSSSLFDGMSAAFVLCGVSVWSESSAAKRLARVRRMLSARPCGERALRSLTLDGQSLLHAAARAKPEDAELVRAVLLATSETKTSSLASLKCRAGMLPEDCAWDVGNRDAYRLLREARAPSSSESSAHLCDFVDAVWNLREADARRALARLSPETVHTAAMMIFGGSMSPVRAKASRLCVYSGEHPMRASNVNDMYRDAYLLVEHLAGDTLDEFYVGWRERGLAISRMRSLEQTEAVAAKGSLRPDLFAFHLASQPPCDGAGAARGSGALLLYLAAKLHPCGAQAGVSRLRSAAALGLVLSREAPDMQKAAISAAASSTAASFACDVARAFVADACAPDAARVAAESAAASNAWQLRACLLACSIGTMDGATEETAADAIAHEGCGISAAWRVVSCASHCGSRCDVARLMCELLRHFDSYTRWSLAERVISLCMRADWAVRAVEWCAEGCDRSTRASGAIRLVRSALERCMFRPCDIDVDCAISLIGVCEAEDRPALIRSSYLRHNRDFLDGVAPLVLRDGVVAPSEVAAWCASRGAVRGFILSCSVCDCASDAFRDAARVLLRGGFGRDAARVALGILGETVPALVRKKKGRRASL